MFWRRYKGASELPSRLALYSLVQLLCGSHREAILFEKATLECVCIRMQFWSYKNRNIDMHLPPAISLRYEHHKPSFSSRYTMLTPANGSERNSLSSESFGYSTACPATSIPNATSLHVDIQRGPITIRKFRHHRYQPRWRLRGSYECRRWPPTSLPCSPRSLAAVIRGREHRR